MAKYIYMYLNHCYIPKCKWGAARLCLCRFFIIYRLYVIYVCVTVGAKAYRPWRTFADSVGSRKTSNNVQTGCPSSTCIFFSFWFGSVGVCSLRTLPLCTVLTTSGAAQTMKILFKFNTHGNGLLSFCGPDAKIKILPRARIKLLRSLGIDSKESIPPACVAWRPGTTYSVPRPHRLFKNSSSGFKEHLSLYHLRAPSPPIMVMWCVQYCASFT